MSKWGPHSVSKSETCAIGASASEAASPRNRPGRWGHGLVPMSELTRRRIRAIIQVTMVRQPFTLVYDPEVKYHLRAIERKHHSLIHERIREQLRFEPDSETRNRKPLEP